MGWGTGGWGWGAVKRTRREPLSDEHLKEAALYGFARVTKADYLVGRAGWEDVGFEKLAIMDPRELTARPRCFCFRAHALRNGCLQVMLSRVYYALTSRKCRRALLQLHPCAVICLLLVLPTAPQRKTEAAVVADALHRLACG